MGQRGPLPRSGVVYTCRNGLQLDVVIRAHGAPYVYWPKHPLAMSTGHVPVLRLAASEAGYGRDKANQPTPWVTRGQAITPIDGNAWNWDPRNLQVRPLAASFPAAAPAPTTSATKPRRRRPSPKAR